jgi:GMP synthase (glutamine-hydrolysing)
MTDILIFTHTPYCPPGHLAKVLDDGGYSYQVLRADLGELDGIDLDQVRAVAIMGGPMSVNDPLPWLETEVAAIAYLLKRDVPMIGHCLGGQLLAKALGAPVAHIGYTESGWQMMSRLDSDQPSPWLAHLPAQFPIFQWHGDTFALPEGAQSLLSSPWCVNQGFAWGDRVLALQGHPEMTEALINEWLTDWYHLLDDTQPSQQSKAQMQDQLSLRVAELNRVAEGFYRHWLGVAGL